MDRVLAPARRMRTCTASSHHSAVPSGGVRRHCALMIPAVSTQSFGAASIRLASFSFRHGSRHDPQSPTPTACSPGAAGHHRTARCLGSPPAHPFCSTRQMSPSHPIQSWVKVGLVVLALTGGAPRSLVCCCLPPLYPRPLFISLASISLLRVVVSTGSHHDHPC